VVGEPIAVNKARYLINEAKYNDAIELLKKDRSSPYDTRPEYFIAMSYFNMHNLDSALVYTQKVYKQKPRLFKNVGIMCNVLEQQGHRDEALRILDKYLSDFKTDSESWLFASTMFFKAGNTKHAAALIDTAVKYIPADTNIHKQQAFLTRKEEIGSFQAQYDAAMKAYKEQRLKEAVVLFTQIIDKDRKFLEGYEYRAFSYYMLKEYQKSLDDLDYMFKLGIKRGNLYNLQGVDFFSLGRKEEACAGFKASMDMGDRDGLTNYQKFCQPVQK
jgi:putative inorganic carbon (hco3(-)) transporter